MAIAHNVLTSGFDNTNATVFNTAAVTLTSGRRYYILLSSDRSLGYTQYTSVEQDPDGSPSAFAHLGSSTILTPTGQTGIQVWKLEATSTTGSAVVRITAANEQSGMVWLADEVTGHDTAAAEVQLASDSGTATAAPVTIAAPGSGGSVLYWMALGEFAAGIAITEEHTLLDYIDDTERISAMGQHETPGSDTTPGSTWTGSEEFAAIAFEIKAAVTSLINTRQKRFSMMNFASGLDGAVVHTLHQADGSLDKGDRLHLLDLYALVGGATILTPSAVSAVSSVATPSLILGALTLTPGAAVAVATVVAPSIVNVVTLTPSAVAAASSVVAPVLVLGQVSLTPDAVAAVSSVIAPGILFGGLTLTPGTTVATAVVATPTVVRGALVLTPSAVVAAAGIADPTLIFGALTLTPDPTTAASGVAAPIISIGEVVTPGAAVATSSVVAPGLVLGGVTVTPAAVIAASSVGTPTLLLGGLVLTPNAVQAIASIAAPTIVRGTLILTPSAVAAVGSVPAVTIIKGAFLATPDPVVAGALVITPVVTGGEPPVGGDLGVLTIVIHPGDISSLA